MNNEQQTWILKPGHEILNGKDNDYEWTALVKPGEDVTTGFCSTISTTTWEKHFQPLDFSVLTRQVEELADIHFYKDLDPNYQVYQYTETGLSGLWILEYKPDKEQLLAGTKEQCFEQWMSFSEPYIDKKKKEIKEFAEQVVLLLLNQEGETK